MPSYESPSNSGSNGIFNIYISSIKKIIIQTLPKIECEHIFSQKSEKNNVPSNESPSNSESNGIYNINISSIKKFYKSNFAQNRM